MEHKTSTSHLEALVKAMARCSPEELAAALAMLPQYHPQGELIVTAAAARVIAEMYSPEDEEAALSHFTKLVALTHDAITKD